MSLAPCLLNPGLYVEEEGGGHVVPGGPEVGGGSSGSIGQASTVTE